MKKDKKPRTAGDFSIDKKPRFDESKSPEKLLEKKPTWRFSTLDFDGPFGWGQLSEVEKIKDIQKRVSAFESMTWAEIEKKKNERGGRQNHLMPKNEISRPAQKRLEEIHMDDIDELYSLRVSSRERIWGTRTPEAFYIIWWDPDHQVYPVGR